jgi:hypothetical protein
MNAALVEKALQAWLSPMVDGTSVLRGLDKEELPTGTSAIVAHVAGIARPFPSLGKAEVILVLATPFHATGGIDAHAALASLLHEAAESASGEGDASLGEHLTTHADLTFAGVCVRDGEQDTEGNRWFSSIPFTLGLRKD